MNRHLHIYDSPEECASAVAQIILKKTIEKKEQGHPLNIAVSGGSTPKLLFNILATEFISDLPWEYLRLFWVDERCVAPDNAESNYGMTNTHLLQKAPIPTENIFRMKGENDPEKEAKYYAKILQKELPQKNNFPIFDLILLGMGDDGHTASIFPDNMELLTADASVAVAVHPQSGQKRITLTGKVLNNAGQSIFLITGASKADVLSAIAQKTLDAKKYPASYIVAADYYIDKQAAEKLS